MPEDVHLLVSEPQQRPLATAIQALKLGFARRVLAEERRRLPGLGTRETRGTRTLGLPHHVWQARYYDFNVCTPEKRVEKLRYMHRNAVRRGLVAAPELWPWSSFRAYAYQERGLVRVNEWGVLKMKSIEPTGFRRDESIRSPGGRNPRDPGHRAGRIGRRAVIKIRS